MYYFSLFLVCFCFNHTNSNFSLNHEQQMWQPRLQPSALQSWQALGAHLVASKKQPQKRLQGSPCKLHHSGSKMVLANGSKGFITHVGDIIRNKRL